MVGRGLSERRALTVVHMSAAALRYLPRPDQNAGLRERIITLAHRHRRYGAGMIYLKLRQEGRLVNHKRVDRLYAEARLQVKRRRRKKVPVVDRQPLLRPQRGNEVWSADFVFDRTAEGRVLKCLTIVDDATTEAVAIVAARALGGLPVTRVLEQLAASRGLPQVLRTDNGLPQKSRRQSFSDLTTVSRSPTRVAKRFPPLRNHTLTIVTQGHATSGVPSHGFTERCTPGGRSEHYLRGRMRLDGPWRRDPPAWSRRFREAAIVGAGT